VNKGAEVRVLVEDRGQSSGIEGTAMFLVDFLNRRGKIKLFSALASL
jgi:hypothetical protein